MAIITMQKMELCGLKQERKPILELVQRFGMIEINVQKEDSTHFFNMDLTKERADLLKKAELGTHALEILETYAKDELEPVSGFQGRNHVSVSYYDGFMEKEQEVFQKVEELTNLEKEIAVAKTEILRSWEQLEMLKPWDGFDVPLQKDGTKQTSIFIGTIPGEWKEIDFLEPFRWLRPFNIGVISSSKVQTCLCIICMKNKAEEMHESLRKLGFSKVNFSENKSPVILKQEWKALLIRNTEKIAILTGKIKGFLQDRDNIKFFIDYMTMRADKYQAISRLKHSRHTFILSGYIPKGKVSEFEEKIKPYQVAINLYEVDEKEDSPVLLKNNFFSAPLESVVESYGLPKKDELDPTFAVSLFYYILFGIMFSDAGYGGILTIACIILLRKNPYMEEGMKRFIKMFLFCGISTIVWGLVFGSFFGNAVSVIGTMFFQNETVAFRPLWFDPVTDPMKMFTFSIVFGAIHIYFALLIKMAQYIKNKDLYGVFFDVVAWYVLLTGCIIIFFSSEGLSSILVLEVPISHKVQKLGSYMALFGSITILLTGGRGTKNIMLRLVQGLYALYGISGYLSDVLSYARLLALGLATGIIGTVINQMGSMGGRGIVSSIGFVLIFVFGHIFNMAINVLGAYVHTNRLQYVEFFGKFYEGGGRKFEPFQLKTKYFNVKEQ